MWTASRCAAGGWNPAHAGAAVPSTTRATVVGKARRPEGPHTEATRCQAPPRGAIALPQPPGRSMGATPWPHRIQTAAALAIIDGSARYDTLGAGPVPGENRGNGQRSACQADRSADGGIRTSTTSRALVAEDGQLLKGLLVAVFPAVCSKFS